MGFASLNPLQPENVAHGSEIWLMALGPGGSVYTNIAELHEVDYDADNKMEKIPMLGTRRTGSRRGRYEGKGTIKGYWLSSYLRSMVLGAPQPLSGGYGSTIYHSQAPFVRYNISVQNSNLPGNAALNPLLVFVAVTLAKDVVKWSADKHTTEDVDFEFEDIIGT